MTEVSLKRAPYLLPHRRNVFSFRLVFQQSGKLSEDHQVGAENYGCAFTGDTKPVNKTSNSGRFCYPNWIVSSKQPNFKDRGVSFELLIGRIADLPQN